MYNNISLDKLQFYFMCSSFLEREPIINYIDSEGEFHENVTLTNDICMDLNGKIIQ